MEPPSEPTPTPTSLRAIRVVALVATLFAVVGVVLAFDYGIAAGLVALFLLPAVPLVCVLAFESLIGSAD